MSKTRQRWPDGTIAVRTFPVTFLHDHTERRCDRKWHLLAFATRGHLEIVDRRFAAARAERARRVDPAGTSHTSVMRAPISMRSIFVASRLAPKATALRTIAVEPLLRELILLATKIGALDRGVPEQARLAAVLLDRLAAAPDVVYELRSPRDPRARRFAELVAGSPGDDRTIAELARAAGTSLRTLERCYLAETGLAVGEWRRRVRLFHALHRLQRGDSVTEVALDCGYATPSAFGVAFRAAVRPRAEARPARVVMRYRRADADDLALALVLVGGEGSGPALVDAPSGGHVRVRQRDVRGRRRSSASDRERTLAGLARRRLQRDPAACGSAPAASA